MENETENKSTFQNDSVPEETRALLKILELGNLQIQEGKTLASEEVFNNLNKKFKLATINSFT